MRASNNVIYDIVPGAEEKYTHFRRIFNWWKHEILSENRRTKNWQIKIRENRGFRRDLSTDCPNDEFYLWKSKPAVRILLFQDCAVFELRAKCNEFIKYYDDNHTRAARRRRRRQCGMASNVCIKIVLPITRRRGRVRNV